ncbi:MAG: arsenate reductase ArsC [Candidatus Sumerlaeia bacterium]|nr:arsenate reductase ArsC [Candidatus Sumerlaeia bacterium]
MSSTLPRILFLCTGNSCRSQMAEGYARQLRSQHFQAYSAGIVAHGQNSNAIRVMAEDGVDITVQQSKTLQSLLDAGVTFDVVFTVCGHADENCPLFPGKTRVIHHGFDDPPKLAKSAATAEEALQHYRRVRDEIRAWVQGLELPSSTL